jgi:glycosyltransferase involved in cell wall biosynthesis
VFVAPTRFAADITRPHLPARTRCEELMYPVADDLLRPESKRTPADRLVVGFAGRALRIKGLHVLLDAVAGVAGKVPLDLHIETATNEGEERDYWQPLKDRAAAMDNVRWRESGVLDSGALRAFHAGIDVLAVPSLWPEYVGFVALEAMALGTPVVLSDFASQRELLIGEGNGDVVTAGDAGALGAGLERCWRRKRAGVRPAPVTPAHPATEYGRRLVAIYEDVLA